MPNCSNCGQSVGEYDRFCSRCGYALAPPPPNQQNTLFSRYPPKPSTNLANGMMIGVGVTALIVGLSIAALINYQYNLQVSFFAAEGIPVNSYSFFGGVVAWITFGVFMAIYGAYFLILGCVNQFSIAARTALNLKDTRARYGTGLITGGLAFAALTLCFMVQQSYLFPPSLSYGYVNTISVVVGLALVLAGAFLIRSAYLRSQHKPSS